MDPQTNQEKSSIYELVTEVTDLCEICFSTRHSTKSIVCPCNHNFCSLCFSDYYSAQRSMGSQFPLQCPLPDCQKDIHSSLTHILDFDDYETYKKQLKRYKLLCNPNIAWCPIINCEGYGLIEGGKSIKCNSCEVEIMNTVNPSAKEILDQFSVVECPGCRGLVGRTFGCMNVRCYCGTSFCSKCGRVKSDLHEDWVCLASNEKQDISPWCITLALLMPVLVPILPVCILYIYRNYWDKNYVRVLNEWPYLYGFLIFLFSPMILVFSLFYLPFIWGWYCAEALIVGKNEGLWLSGIKAFVYFPAVLLSFIGWLLLLGLVICFSPLYGVVLLARKLRVKKA